MNPHSNKIADIEKQLQNIKKEFKTQIKSLSDEDKKIAKVEIQKIIDGSLIMSQNKELLKELLKDFHV